MAQPSKPFGALAIGGNLRMSEAEFFTILLLLMALAVGVPLLFAFRLWRVWQTARRTSLLWVIVHSNLLTALIIVALIMVWQGGNGLNTVLQQMPKAKPVFVIISSLLPVLFSMIVAIPPIVGLMALTAFTAYYTAKPIIARLDALAKHMETLQAGDYTVRSPLEGQVEVQRLQTGFNNMATELEKILQALKQERDSINHLLEARRELFSEVSHELRTPAAILRAYLDSLLMNWQTRPAASLGSDLEIMSHETDRLQRLLDDLFLLARVEVGKLELQTAPLDASDLIKKMVETVAPLAWERGRVRVIAELPPELPTIVADAGRLEQILQNLLQNAIRHTPPGGMVAVYASEESEAEMVRIEVRDTGSGITSDELLHIWERFYHGEQTGNTGIGLTLVKELTTAMGGIVNVESTPGQGSCFTIRLRSVDSSI